MNVIVVGGGISGLATAYAVDCALKQTGTPATVRVLEAGKRAGGIIQTHSDGGFRLEGGPNGFLDSKPHTLDLVKKLSLSDEVLVSSDAARHRFVLLKDGLCALPTSPGQFLRSPILSIGGRFRVIRERWTRPGGHPRETVAEFARRRLGRQAAERLIDPFVSGIFAGDPENLSVRAAFPRLVELEETYGSLIKASVALKKARKGEGAGSGGAAGPGGRLTSFNNGMQTLIDALADTLAPNLHTDCAVTAIEKQPSGSHWTVRSNTGTWTDVDAVVLAIPGYRAATLLEPINDEVLAPLNAIPYAAVAVVALGFDAANVAHALDGFGFLVPHSEGRPFLGCLWTSSVFPGRRAPDGHVLLRTMVGGARAPERVSLSDADITETVMSELRPLLGIEGQPALQHVTRYSRAIPQYTPGHLERVASVETALQHHPGLFITGNAFKGVGINDCTRSAQDMAEKIVGYVMKSAG